MQLQGFKEDIVAVTDGFESFFVARRAIPSVLYSDNALTFEAASRELDTIYQVLDIQVQNFCATSHI